MLNINFFYELLINLVIYIIPTYIYIKYKEKEEVLVYLKLKENVGQGVLIGVVVSSIFIILLFTKNAIIGSWKINLNLGIFWISGLLVGFLEEIPFRGFLLQKFSNYMSFWRANILTTVLFVSCHIPTWINSNKPILQTAISISFASLALGYLFKKYNSLWIPIICHSIYDLCFWMGL